MRKRNLGIVPDVDQTAMEARIGETVGWNLKNEEEVPRNSARGGSDEDIEIETMHGTKAPEIRYSLGIHGWFPHVV